MDVNDMLALMRQQGLLNQQDLDFDDEESDDGEDDDLSDDYDDGKDVFGGNDDVHEDYNEDYEEDEERETGLFTQMMSNNAKDMAAASSGYVSEPTSLSHSPDMAMEHEHPNYMSGYGQQNRDAGYSSPLPMLSDNKQVPFNNRPLPINDSPFPFNDRPPPIRNSSPMIFDAPPVHFDDWTMPSVNRPVQIFHPPLRFDDDEQIFEPQIPFREPQDDGPMVFNSGPPPGAGRSGGGGWQSSDAFAGVAGPPLNMSAFTPKEIPGSGALDMEALLHRMQNNPTAAATGQMCDVNYDDDDDDDCDEDEEDSDEYDDGSCTQAIAGGPVPTRVSVPATGALQQQLNLQQQQSNVATSGLILVDAGRVHPDSSVGLSSSGSDGGRVKNATRLASLSNLPSATDSLRQRRLSETEVDLLEGSNTILIPGIVPLLIETPTVGWTSLVGHENAKNTLKSLFQESKFPEVFDSQGSCRGVLLFGPSGAGKTSLARSLSYESAGAKLIACTPSFVLNREVHPQSAALLIRQLFDQAKVHKPCVMLMKEIEILSQPDLPEAGKWAKAELMAQVRGETTLEPKYPPNNNNINDHVMLVATTCRPWLLSPELRRLFAYNIHIKLPSQVQRFELFRIYLNNYTNNVTGDQFRYLLSESEGYSATDIHTVTRHASYNHQSRQSDSPLLTYEDIASVMTNYKSLHKQEDSYSYKTYIQEATHTTDDLRQVNDKKKKKRKGLRKFWRLSKSFVFFVLASID